MHYLLAINQYVARIVNYSCCGISFQNTTMNMCELKKELEQLPHQLAALSTQSGSRANDRDSGKDMVYHLQPPNTSYLEETIKSVNNRWAGVLNQIDNT